MANQLGKLMEMMGGSQNGAMNPMAMIMQMMNGKMNPQTMINMMIKQNPQMAQIWQQAQQMSNGKSPQEMETLVKEMCQKNGIDFNQAMSMLNQFKK